MKTLLLALVCFSFFTKAYACEQGEISFVKNNLCAQSQWIAGPALNQFSTLSVKLSENTNLKLNVIPWMVMSAGHEHGSRPVTTTILSPSDYLFEKIYFMGGMSGDWYIRYQLINDKKEIVEEVRSLIKL